MTTMHGSRYGSSSRLGGALPLCALVLLLSLLLAAPALAHGAQDGDHDHGEKAMEHAEQAGEEAMAAAEQAMAEAKEEAGEAMAEAEDEAEDAMQQADEAMAKAEHAMHGDHHAHPIQPSLVRNLDGANDKLLQLAEAIPADKYTWRPADGVRSVSEVFMHVAGANYFLASPFGVDLPEGVALRELEKESDKQAVIDRLRDSIEHAHQAMESADLGQSAETMQFFGQDMARGDILLILLAHAHEHLGQAIAYARSIGVVPPWSAQEEG